MSGPTRADMRRLFRLRALRCEALEDPRGTCECGGRLRGRPHSDAWLEGVIDDETARIHAEWTGGPLFGAPAPEGRRRV